MASCALLLADDPMTADLGAYLLRRDGMDVVLAASKQEALRQLSGQKFNPLLMYCQAFDPECAEFVRLARCESSAAILVVALEQNDPAVLAAYQAGADDYLGLPTSPAIFLAKVRAWTRRTESASLDISAGLQAGGLRLDASKKRVSGPYGPAVHLSTLETHVLHLLMLHQGQVLPADYILERVWGCKGKENATLVKNVIYRLCRKIDMPSGGVAHIETADSGYVFQVQEP